MQCPSRAGGNVSVLLWWIMSERAASDPKFLGLWRKMLDCDDDKWRGTRLKLIPAVRILIRTSLLLPIVIVLLLE